ncbi:prolipoprotein diacylglyceryl transferase [Spiroplasma endosymbiont of Aspidapion aeneum]|uniref:prolipoprotein diacylglyceryl transferase n=1 Tax=Spiroplasma endosymbiont of Aspidapion aeneum TaxID=3066276 RepID=UPI00313C2429
MLTNVWEMEWFNHDENKSWTINGDYGFIHMYALFMTLGVTIAIAVSAIKLWRKQVPLTGLYIGAIPIVIVSLFGASYFGKMPVGVSFWNCFKFWQGGMSIHGGVLFGGLSGIVIFYIIGRYTGVSVLVYMDAIIPNILLGQAIGRWGNFFNHELVGQPLCLAGQHNTFSWLPNFILNNTQFQYFGPDNLNYKGLILVSGQSYQMTPIFIIESFFLTISWILITFIVPGIGRWISKKPWNIDQKSFAIDWRNSFRKPFSREKTEIGYSYFEVWNRAFYSNTDIESAKQYCIEVKNLNNEYYEKIKNKEKCSYLRYRARYGKSLLKANNPNKYHITYCGIEAGVYFFLWNIVRLSLESIRPEDVLFISYKRDLSLVLVACASIIGVAIILLSIFIFPYLSRKEDFVFEKKYFLISGEETKLLRLKDFRRKSEA